MSQLPWSDTLVEDLAARRKAGRYRQARVREGAQGVRVVVDGQAMLSFCSNDYLGLAGHPEIKKAFIDAAETDGVGSGAAHLLGGHSRHHQALEEALADFTGHQRVLLFSSGYQANLGVIDGLMAKGDAILQDKLNHASLLDGGRLSAAKQWRYQHNDMTALARRLEQTKAITRRLIVTDGVFSMDGDQVALPELMTLAQHHRAAVLVDDAHGLGVIGQHGRGSISLCDAEALPILMGTFGKALGTAGAFVAADEVVIETLTQQARTFVYTTAQPAALAAATLKSLAIVQEETWRREKLQALISQFRAGATALGLSLMPSETAIQPIIVGDVERVNAVGLALEKRGLLVGAIRPPTVPEGAARLRVTLSAAHSEQDIVQLLDALEAVLCTSQS